MTIPWMVAVVLLFEASPAHASCGSSGTTRESELRAAVDGVYTERSLDTVLVGVIAGEGASVDAGDDEVPDHVFPVGVYTPRPVRVLAEFHGGGSESLTLLVPGGLSNGLVTKVSDVPQLQEGVPSLIIGRGTGNGTVVIGSCTPTGTLSGRELSMLLAHQPRAVVYDNSLTGDVAVTGVDTAGPTYFGGALVALGATLLLAVGVRDQSRTRLAAVSTVRTWTFGWTTSVLRRRQ